jgi:hypothetical protein
MRQYVSLLRLLSARGKIRIVMAGVSGRMHMASSEGKHLMQNAKMSRYLPIRKLGKKG